MPPAVPEGGAGPWSGVPAFDVSFSAGGSTLVADDLNKGARGLAGLDAAALDAAPSGAIGSLHLAYLFGLDASCRLSRNFSLTAGIEYMRGWRSGNVSYPGAIIILASGPSTTTHVFVQAVPVKIGFRFYPRPDFYIRASAVYYLVRAGYDDRGYVSLLDWQAWTGRATAGTLGMEVAAGGEWRLGPHLVGFAEAGFRLTPDVGLDGTGTSTDSTGAARHRIGPAVVLPAAGRRRPRPRPRLRPRGPALGRGHPRRAQGLAQPERNDPPLGSQVPLLEEENAWPSTRSS